MHVSEIEALKSSPLPLYLQRRSSNINFKAEQAGAELGQAQLPTGIWLYFAGRHIHMEPGNQVPKKFISSSEFFGRMHMLLRIDRIV